MFAEPTLVLVVDVSEIAAIVCWALLCTCAESDVEEGGRESEMLSDSVYFKDID